MSKNLLLFTGEQWELIRRLRNSGLTQDQICQAYDDLERIERELGNLYNLPFNTNTNNSDSNNGNTTNAASNGLSSTPCTAVNALFADPTLFAKNMQNFQLLMAKNIAALNYRQRIANTDTNSNSSNASSTSNTPVPSNVNTNNQQLQLQQQLQIETNNSKNLTNNNNNNVNHNSNNSSNNTSILNNNNNNNKNSNDIQDEVKELEEFRTKGDANIHYEISHFVYKYDLKQSQIARMAGVNQAYVSKFLRGDFNDLSENGKTLIYKWYLKFTKNPIMLAKQQNGCNDNNNNSCNGSEKTSSKLDNFSFVNMVNTYDTPKRTRFSFKPDHLMILEKSFLDNAYPDPKKREELARLCNNVRTNGELSDRERVTEQIVTHWFQNKRKLARKATGDMTGMQTQSSNDETTSFNDQNGDSTPFEYENEIESPLNYQDFMDEAQMAACKAIMSRMNSSPAKSNDFTNDDLTVKLEMM